MNLQINKTKFTIFIIFLIITLLSIYIVDAITFSTNSVGVIAMTPINSTAFCMVWCDLTEDDVTYACFDAAGNTLRAATDINTDINCPSGVSHSVDIVAGNRTYINVVFIDSSGDTFTDDSIYAIIDWEAGVTISTGKMEDGVGDSQCVATDVLGKGGSFLNIWIADSTGNLIAETRNVAGSVTNGPTQLNIVGLGAAAGCDISCFNATHCAVVYTDADASPSDLYYRVIKNDHTSVVAETLFDSDVGVADYSIAAKTYNGTHWSPIFYDSTDDDYYYAILTANGASILSATSFNTFVSAADNILDAANINFTAFVSTTDSGSVLTINISDRIGATAKHRSWNYDGTQGFSAIASRNVGSNISLCNQTIVYADSSGTWYANFTHNSSAWNGVCLEASTVSDTCTPPSINTNWVIENGDICTLTAQNIDLGTGNLSIIENSRLILIDSNLTCNYVTYNATTSNWIILNISWSDNYYKFNISGLFK